MKLLDSLSSFANQLTRFRDRPLDFCHFSKYESGGWLYRAAVDRIALDCFRRGYKWIAEGDDISRIESVENSLSIVDKKRRALQLARLDGEGYIYFDDGRDPSKEITIENGGPIRFANVMRRSDVKEGEEVKDPLSPYYGLPEMYKIGDTRIHASRLCRLVANRDPATGRGVSTLSIVDEVIQSALCTRRYIVDLVGEARIDVMKVQGLADAVSDPEMERQLVRRYELAANMKANLAMLVMDMDGEDYDQKQSSFATLPDILEAVRREVSAALQIPHAILFGREQGLGSNGEMELVSYYDTVSTMQTNEVQPATELLDRLVVKTATGRADNDIYYEWNSLKQPTDKEQQEIGTLIADRHAKLVAAEFPREVLEGPTVNALVEAGIAPGLEKSYNDWLEGMTDED